ncbi:FUSC family protein [Kitasatospora sp. NPDC094015]|uniref:FUSC family protein n=1 Tax=Kitasatospora sp. NPDC094015 TaxID=3155205 RepID=UPI00331A6DE9
MRRTGRTGWWERRAVGLPIGGLRPSWSWPEPVPVLRSLLGLVLVVTAALACGSPAAAAGAGSGAAVAGAVALPPDPRGRLRPVLGVSVAMGAATLVGAVTAPYAAAFVAAATLWSFGAGMLWALGAGAGAVAAASGVLLVGSAALAPTLGHTLGAAALATGGGLVQAALVALLPAHPRAAPQWTSDRATARRWSTQRDALAAAYRALAAHARALTTDPRASVDPAPPAALREAFTLTDRQAARRPPAFRGLYGLPERLGPTLTAVARPTAEPGAPDDVRGLLHRAADLLDALADGRREAATSALTALDAQLRHTGPRRQQDRRLAEQLGEAIDLAFGGLSPGPEEVERVRRPDLRTGLATAVRTITAQRSTTSPVLRHALRLAAATGAACAIARGAELAHGYWIALTVLMVLRPETSRTYGRCLARLAGNAVGVLLATAILVSARPGPGAEAALAVASIGCAYLLSRTGYLALSASVAAAIVFLVATTGADGSTTVTDRLAATAIGGALAVLAHLLLPDRGEERLRERIREAAAAHRRYARAASAAHARPGRATTTELRDARRAAARTRGELDAVASQVPGTVRARLRTDEIRTVLDRLRAAGALLETAAPGPASVEQADGGAADGGGPAEVIGAADRELQALGVEEGQDGAVGAGS